MRDDDSPDDDMTLEALKERGDRVMAESQRIAVRIREHLATLEPAARYMVGPQWIRRRSRMSKPERP